MNALMEIKKEAIDFERKHRILPKTIGAVSAMQLAAFSVFAEEGSGGVDISTVTNAMTTSLTDLVGKVATACAGVVGAGLSIFAIKWAVTKVMSFFKAIGR